MDDDLILIPVQKYVVLGNVIDLNYPVGQFVMIVVIFILFTNIKSRLFLSEFIKHGKTYTVI